MFDVSDDQLEEIHGAAKAMLKALKGMQVWGVMMGGWESSKWQAVDEAVKQAEAAGITTGEDDD